MSLGSGEGFKEYAQKWRDLAGRVQPPLTDRELVDMFLEMMLMVTIRDEDRFKDQWYLDSGCSSHMFERKDWFINIKPSMKNTVKFSNDNTLADEGIGYVMIMRKDGKRSVISNVLYIPGMDSNLYNIGQLVEKNYKVLIKDKMMRVVNANGILKLKAPMS